MTSLTRAAPDAGLLQALALGDRSRRLERASPRDAPASSTQRPRAEQQVDALVGDQLAHEHHQPIAPSRIGRCSNSHRRDVRSSRAKRARRVHRRGRRGRAWRAACSHSACNAPRRPPRRRRAAESAPRPPREGPGACALGTAGSSSASHRLRAVWLEPTRIALAPASPSRAGAEEALGFGLDGVLQRAAVHLHGIGHGRRRERARGSRDPSRDGWRAPPWPHPLGDLAHRRHVGLRCSAAPPLRCTPRRCAPAMPS